MPLSADEIRKVARLARLALEERELGALGAQLNDIVSYIEQLQEVDVEGIEPLFHAVPLELRRREDRVHEGIGRKALEGSVGYEEGLVKVPKIVE